MVLHSENISGGEAEERNNMIDFKQTPTIHTGRLRYVAEKIRAYPEHFDYRHFGNLRADEEGKPYCGTAGCIGGWGDFLLASKEDKINYDGRGTAYFLGLDSTIELAEWHWTGAEGRLLDSIFYGGVKDLGGEAGMLPRGLFSPVSEVYEMLITICDHLDSGADWNGAYGHNPDRVEGSNGPLDIEGRHG